MPQVQDSGWVFNKLPTNEEFKNNAKLKKLETANAEIVIDFYVGYVELGKNTVNMILEALGGCIYPTTIGLDIFFDENYDVIKLQWNKPPTDGQFNVTIDMNTPPRINSLALRQNYTPEKYRLSKLSEDFTWAVFNRTGRG